MTTTVHFDAEKLAALKAAYVLAVAKGDESFTLDGNQYLAAYAKYLIEYLEMQFRERG